MDEAWPPSLDRSRGDAPSRHRCFFRRAQAPRCAQATWAIRHKPRHPGAHWGKRAFRQSAKNARRTRNPRSHSTCFAVFVHILPLVDDQALWMHFECLASAAFSAVAMSYETTSDPGVADRPNSVTRGWHQSLFLRPLLPICTDDWAPTPYLRLKRRRFASVCSRSTG